MSPVVLLEFLAEELKEVRRVAGLPPLPAPGREAPPAVLAHFRVTAVWLTMAEYRQLKSGDVAEKARATSAVRLWRREIATGYASYITA